MANYNDPPPQGALSKKPHPVHIGLDVHKDSIAVAVARRVPHIDELEVIDYGSIVNRTPKVVNLVAQVQHRFRAPVHVVYEAGPCGFVLRRHLQQCDYHCSVVVPSLIPKRPGDRVKTDRKDAQQLAKLSLLGLLTEVWVPDEVQESLRDLVRLRDDLRISIQKQRQQLNHYVLRNGHHWGRSKWTAAHRAWLKDLKFPTAAGQIALVAAMNSLQSQEAHLAQLDAELRRESSQWHWHPLIDSLRALRGIDHLSAITIVAEIGDLRRFSSAPQFMAYLGLVPSELSSGNRRRTGALTKTGNCAVRRILIESAWSYRFTPRQTKHLQKKAKQASNYARQRAWAAQQRLCPRYLKMLRNGKNNKTVIAAIARELAGFIWDIGCHELNRMSTPPATINP